MTPKNVPLHAQYGNKHGIFGLIHPKKYRLNDTFRIHLQEYIVVSFQITRTIVYAPNDSTSIWNHPHQAKENQTNSSTSKSNIKQTQIINSIFENLSVSKSVPLTPSNNCLGCFPIWPDNIPLFPPTGSDPFFLGYPCSNNLHMSRRLGVEAKKSRSKQSMKYLAVALGNIFQVVPEDVLGLNQIYIYI